MCVIENVADKINPAGGHREYLVVAFDYEVKLRFQILFHFLKKVMQILLAS